MITLARAIRRIGIMPSTIVDGKTVKHFDRLSAEELQRQTTALIEQRKERRVAARLKKASPKMEHRRSKNRRKAAKEDKPTKK